MSEHRIEKREVAWTLENALIMGALLTLGAAGALLIGFQFSWRMINWTAVISVVGGLVMAKTFKKGGAK